MSRYYYVGTPGDDFTEDFRDAEVTAPGATAARTLAEIEGDTAKVEGDGAVGDAANDDTQAIWKTIARAGVGGTVTFKPGKTYLIKAPIIPLEKQTWVGYGAAIKRANETRTTLTAGKSAGASPGVVSVASSAGFYAGMYVTLHSSTIADDEAGSSGELRNWLVTAVGTGTVTLSGAALGKSYVIGDYLVTAYDMILDNLVTQGKNRILGLIVDGNHAGNTTHRRWECVSGLRMASDYSVVSDCIFLNSPSDAIVYSGTGFTIEHNTILDTQGNGIHLGATYGGKITANHIYNCTIRGVANGHADGGIIASNLVYDTLVDGNYVEQANGFSGIGSWNTYDNYGISITSNYLKTVGGTSRGGIEILTDTGTVNGRATITGNVLINARAIVVMGTNITGDWSLTNGLESIVISGNYLESTGISVRSAVSGVSITGNALWKAPSVGASSFLQNNEHVYVGSFTHGVTITGNSFLDTANTTRECIRTGAADSVVVTGNTIRGYGRHVYFGTAAGVGSTNCRASVNGLTDPAIDLYIDSPESRGCAFTNNTASVAAAIGGAVVSAYNGTRIADNDITTASTIGIRLYGGAAGVPGAIVLHNTVRGSGLAVAAIYAGAGPNNVVEWNYAKTGAAFTDAVGTNTFTNNKNIVT